MKGHPVRGIRDGSLFLHSRDPATRVGRAAAHWFALFGYVLYTALFSCLTACGAFPDTDHITANGPHIASAGTAVYPEIAGHLWELMALENSITSYPLIAGNDIQLLIDGPSAFEAMFAAIEKAEHHIHFETFIINNDLIGREFADKLIERSAAGVEVRLIYDAIGGLGADEAYMERLRENGIQLYKFHPVNPLENWRLWRLNSRHHRKILVVDGKVAFSGGLNISEVYSSSSFSASPAEKDNKEGWRDTHIKIEGPAVAQLQDLFFDLWNEQENQLLERSKEYFPYLPLAGSDCIRVIESIAGGRKTEIYQVYLAAIIHAADRIWITQGYFSPNDVFINSLKNAAASGVDVRLLLPGRTDSWITVNSSRAHYQELLENGVRIFERRDALQHAKTAVIDGRWSTVGSSNLDYRSFLHANEANVVIWGIDFAQLMEGVFLIDQDMNQEILPDEWRNRPFYRWIIEGVASMFDYWL